MFEVATFIGCRGGDCASVGMGWAVGAGTDGGGGNTANRSGVRDGLHPSYSQAVPAPPPATVDRMVSTRRSSVGFAPTTSMDGKLTEEEYCRRRDQTTSQELEMCVGEGGEGGWA